MSKLRVAINGFGRIGRLIFKALLENEYTEVVAINDLAENNTLAHLLKYDSVHGRFAGTVGCDEEYLYVNNQRIHAMAESHPEKLPWKKLEIDLVVECTGRFRKRELAALHIEAGAQKVLISAPAYGDIPMVVLGVNEEILSEKDVIISNASCTTNCLAPMVKVLHENFGLEKAYATTIHAYTADQNLQDAPHKKDLRRARAAAMNIVPTTTNAGQALGVVMPELAGKIDATAVRVPVIDGSLTEVNAILTNEASAEQISKAFKAASDNGLNGILEYTEDPLVSTDIVGNPHSCIFDASLTKSMGKFINITGWYDNETGYAIRLKDLINYMIQLKD